MKIPFTIVLLVLSQLVNAQVVLQADGPGDTYELITSVLAPGENPIEAPDCNHESFGEHIDEIFDEELNAYVFRFHIHTEPDNDRCINFDRQRNEIKSYSRSPDNLLGVQNEKVNYKWKFKLAEGFQSSPNFTHIHQLKSVGGNLASMPMYTLTTRKGSPDRLELRYAETDRQVTLSRTDLAPLIGTWLEVSETIEYGDIGSYKIEIKRVDNDEILFSYANDALVNWRPGAEFVRPKWGIYRSLINAQDLRDEEVLYADFSVEEFQSTSSIEKNFAKAQIYPNPVNDLLTLDNLAATVDRAQIISMDGKVLIDQRINAQSSIQLNVSSLKEGVYILNLKDQSYYQTEIFVIAR